VVLREGRAGRCAAGVEGIPVKIIPKLTMALVSGTCVVLAANAYFRVQRERTYFEADRLRDHEMIGRSLGAAAAAVWKSDGEQAAIRAIDAVNVHFSTIHIHWVPSDRTGKLGTDPQLLRAAPAGQPLTRIERDADGESSVWNTYVPLDVDGSRRGVIELSEPATSEGRFVRRTIADTMGATAVLAALMALMSFVLGQWLVGAPVRALSEKARRVGQGDFSGPVARRQRDELGQLAREMNAMSDRLVATMEQLRHADRLAIVGKLASGVAHELGTPLNVVLARAGMIASGEATPEESREYAKVIAGAADRMTKTIRRLLQFARRGGVQKSKRDVRELVKDTLELLGPLADKRSVALVLAPGQTDASASVDGGQIQQVITNLVMNAIQAIPSGGTVEIEVGRERGTPPAGMDGGESEWLCLKVADDGEGISPEHLPHVFEPFFTTKDIGEGTGLGLAVTYGIIREHGGFIAVESKVHQGTTFSVFLPLSEVA
jgi:signal transduction histidine kinase